jgi:hypothetical protein
VRLAPGLRLGPYEVLAVLGKGGMAEVYRARDTRLGREIALKVVNESLASNPELLQRFEKEARLAGSLNHPNLVAVYDVGQHEGSPFLVTELLQGESLRKRLSSGPMAVKTAVDSAAQMARGLAAAHARGVVHRDVKPDNVFVSADGQVKLLDFGIAKLSEVAPVGAPRGLMDATETPTGGATRTGAMLGTPGYMSPEQLRGESVDARSDVFSLGAVLFEMLSGQRAFPGSLVESGYAILHNAPAPLSDKLPPVLVQVVNRCLEKEPSRRFQSASDLAFDLEMLWDPTSATGRGAFVPRSVPRRVRWLVAGVALVVLLGLGLVRFTSHPRATALATLPTQIEQITYRWGFIRRARFMPDGRVALSAAFEGKPEEVFIRPPGMSSLQPVGVSEAGLAAVSRTGELAVVLGNGLPMGTLARLPNVGGAPREVAENVGFADWSPTGELAVVVLGPNGHHTLESPPGKVLFRSDTPILDPRFSSRGDLIAFLRITDEKNEVCVVDLEGHARTVNKSWAFTRGLAWAPDDAEIWFTAGSGQFQRNAIVATDLAGKTREVYRSVSTILLEDIASDGRVLVSTQAQRFDVLYLDFEKGTNAVLSWTRLQLLGSFSADRKVLMSVEPGTLFDVSIGQAGWTSSQTQSESVVVLRKPDGSFNQVLGEGVAGDLSLDGRWALVTSRDGKKLTALPTGPGQPRVVPTHGLAVRLGQARWLPDGKSVVVLATSPDSAGARLYRLAGDDSPPALVSKVELDPGTLIFLSPDGRTVATGRGDVLELLRGKREASGAGPRDGFPVLISLSDGTTSQIPGFERGFPRGWSRDGHLWLSFGERATPARARLLKINTRNGRILEERVVAPPDPTGTGALGNIILTPDGKGAAFNFSRSLGEAYIIHGLASPANGAR